MKWRKILFLIGAIGLLLGLWPAAGLASKSGETPAAATEIVEKELLDTLEVEGSSDFVVVLAEQPDLSKALEIGEWSERGRFVYNTLLQTAARSQAPVIAYIQDRGIEYRSFFSNNAVYLKGGDLEAVCVKSPWPVFYLTKTVSAGDFSPGDPVTYTVIFGNDGSLETGITISDVLPAEVAYAWSYPAGVYDPTMHELAWQNSALQHLPRWDRLGRGPRHRRRWCWKCLRDRAYQLGQLSSYAGGR